MSTRRTSSVVVFSFTSLVAASAGAAPREFNATLERIDACAADGVSGSAALVIDDESGAVEGTLTLSGFPAGANVNLAAILNAAAGDNIVGSFAGVAAASPNGEHSVTTTLNEFALPAIIEGTGVVEVRAEIADTTCNFGAVRGALVEGAAEGEGEGGAGEGEGEEEGEEEGEDDGGGGCSNTPVAPFASLVPVALLLVTRRRR